MKIKTINNSAFSILEVIIAISIMAIGMLGVTSLMVQNLQVSNIDRDYLTAAMLAQEGLELVRNKRDLNWLTDGANWYDDIINDGDYVIDYYPSSDTEINIDVSVDDISDAGARLMVDEYGYYAHNIGGGVNTDFYRLIEVTDNTTNLEISCTVRFKRLSQVKDYIAITRLYPWRY